MQKRKFDDVTLQYSIVYDLVILDAIALAYHLDESAEQNFA